MSEIGKHINCIHEIYFFQMPDFRSVGNVIQQINYTIPNIISVFPTIPRIWLNTEVCVSLKKLTYLSGLRFPVFLGLDMVLQRILRSKVFVAQFTVPRRVL